MFEQPKVKDAMTTRIATVGETDSVQTAAELMKKRRVGSLMVVRGKNPIGIITESDIIKKIVSLDLSAGNVKVKEIMSKPLKFLGPEENLAAAVRKMIANKTRRMPVIKDGELVGILTHTDIAKAAPSMIDILSQRGKMRDGETQATPGTSTGMCDSCGNYSEILTPTDNEWLCEDCLQEKLTQEQQGF